MLYHQEESSHCESNIDVFDKDHDEKSLDVPEQHQPQHQEEEDIWKGLQDSKETNIETTATSEGATTTCACTSTPSSSHQPPPPPPSPPPPLTTTKTTQRKQEGEEDEPKQEQPKQSKQHVVTFSSVHIRYYEVVLGNHPCCHSSCPLSLGWNYHHEQYFPTVNDYEASQQQQQQQGRCYKLRCTSSKERYHRLLLLDNSSLDHETTTTITTTEKNEFRKDCRFQYRHRDARIQRAEYKRFFQQQQQQQQGRN